MYSPSGSSPRWRGAQLPRADGDAAAGLIPAVAGSTSGPARGRSSWRAHPRGGGEHPQGEVARASGPGSSPRWRERGSVCAGPNGWTGSSPRWRGARHHRRHVRDRTGLIPAVAGSTTIPRRLLELRRAHPRGGGEHWRGSNCPRRWVGSSPRWRGAQHHRPVGVQPPGLIPAVAGSTTCDRSTSGFTRAHPRGGGEHISCCSSTPSRPGSSPRWRGALPEVQEHCVIPGLIPAVAGSTVSCSAAGTSSWAHPRGGGEHSVAILRRTTTGGSSPRWRGALSAPLTGRRGTGLIPAVAGSTVGDAGDW